MKLFHRFLIGLLLLSLISPITTASAHKPIWGEENGIIEIPDLVTSYAFYRDLPTGKVDAYYFAGKAGQQFNFGVQMPDLEGLQNYEVTVALFGPDLPEADESQLPPDHPEELGALIFPSTVSEDFFEAFTQTNYLGRQKITTTLPTVAITICSCGTPKAWMANTFSIRGEPKISLLATSSSSLSGGYKFACILDRPYVACYRKRDSHRWHCDLFSAQEKMTSQSQDIQHVQFDHQNRMQILHHAQLVQSVYKHPFG